MKKIAELLVGKFGEIDFKEIEKLEKNIFRVEDETGEMFIRVSDNIAEISFDEKFSSIFETIKF